MAALAALLGSALLAASVTGADPPTLSDAQRDFMTWRFGMFVHFNLGTFADLD